MTREAGLSVFRLSPAGTGQSQSIFHGFRRSGKASSHSRGGTDSVTFPSEITRKEYSIFQLAEPPLLFRQPAKKRVRADLFLPRPRRHRRTDNQVKNPSTPPSAPLRQPDQARRRRRRRQEAQGWRGRGKSKRLRGSASPKSSTDSTTTSSPASSSSCSVDSGRATRVRR